jgi:hypothetical protein
VIADPLRIQPGQERLSPEQEAEARRFAEERIATQLSTELGDEAVAEALVKQAYVVGKLPPPERLLWVDGPLRLVTVLARQNGTIGEWKSVWGSVQERLLWHVVGRVRASIRKRVRARVVLSVATNVEQRVRASV